MNPHLKSIYHIGNHPEYTRNNISITRFSGHCNIVGYAWT